MGRDRCCGRIPGQNVAWASSNVGDRRFVVVEGRPSMTVVYFCFVVVDGRRCSVVVVVGDRRCSVVAGCHESHVSLNNAPMSWNRCAPLSWNRWKWTMHQTNCQ